VGLGGSTRRVQGLAEVAYERYLSAENDKRAEMLRCVGSNFSFDCVTISPTYRKPFDILVDIGSSEEWRPQIHVNRTAWEFAEALLAA
jgi:hypothetical protein